MNLFKKGIKLLHIADVHNRHQGRLYYSTGKKLNNGFIKNDVNESTLKKFLNVLINE